MLTIRKEQLAVLQKKEVQKFGDRMVAHLTEVFPEKSKALGEGGLREIIRYGLSRAASYRIAAERDVCKYIDLMIVFGRDFDRDPNQPWAGAILNDRKTKSPARKMKQLFETAKEREKAQGAARA